MPFNKLVLLPLERYEALLKQQEVKPKNLFPDSLLAELRSILLDDTTKEDDEKLRVFRNLMSRLSEHLHVQKRNSAVELQTKNEEGPLEFNPSTPEKEKTFLNAEKEPEKVEEPSAVADEAEMSDNAFEDAPETPEFTKTEEPENEAVKRYMHALVQHCQNYADVFATSGRGELVVSGVGVPNSSANDLLLDFSNPYRSRSQAPLGTEEFQEALRKTNCPNSVIGNAARRIKKGSSSRSFSVQQWPPRK